MKNLLIDTTTSNITVAVLDGVSILNLFHEKIENDISSHIMQVIDDCLKKSNLTIQKIDKIFVVNGPGSFTGIRIGVTVGKIIAWSLKKEVVPISSLELMATTSTNKEYIVPMIDARRGNVFAGIYDKNLNVVKKDSLVNIDNLISELDDNYELVSYDDLKENIVKPKIDVAKIISKHINDLGINPHKLNPNYLKLTEAEENKLKND